MPLPTFYATGTASVANGATTVTFSGALLGTEADPTIQAGDLFFDPAQPAIPGQRIASVDYDAGTAELWANWPGTTMSSDAYEVRFTGDPVRSTAQTRKLLEELSTVQANGRGLFYVFDDSTTDSDPGAGKLRINAATFAASTGGYIDNLDANGATASAVIDSWDDSASTVRGQLWVRSVASPSVFAALDLTGSVVDGTGYRKLTWTYVGGSGSLAAGDEIMVMFSAKGDRGSDGIDGASMLTRVRAVSTTDITIATALNNGDSLDGVTLATNDLVLVAGQTDAGENGIYVVGTSPARDASFDSFDDHPGVYISVMEGDSYTDTLWRCTSNKGGTLGTTDITFSQYSSGLPAVATRTALKALNTGNTTTAILTESGREGTFVWMTGDYSTQIAADMLEGLYLKANAVASSSGAWVRQYDGPVSVEWFYSGDWDDAFEAAATMSPIVRVPPGSYAISRTMPRCFWLLDGATITGLGTYGDTATPSANIDDLTYLTGRVMQINNDADGNGVLFGDPVPWLERYIRPSAQSRSEVSVVSPNGLIAGTFATKASDHPTPAADPFTGLTMSTVAVNAYAINDQAGGLSTYAIYGEARRRNSGGAALGAEIDVVNEEAPTELNPGSGLGYDAHTIGLLLNSGAGLVGDLEDTTAAMVIGANGSKWRRGVVVMADSVSNETLEAMAVPIFYGYAWYAGEVRFASLDHRDFQRRSDANEQAIGVNDTIRRRRAGGAATQNLDTLFYQGFLAASATDTDYSAGYHRVLQRSNFAGGNASFSHDWGAANADGTLSEFTLNGIADKSLSPVIDDFLSLGAAAFRFKNIYSALATIGRVTGLAAPSAGSDAVNKVYADAVGARQLARNGSFAVAQRSMPTTDNAYCVDGWRLLLEAANAASVAQDTADVPVGAGFALKLTVGSGNNNKFGVFSPIENKDTLPLRGGACSLRVPLKATAGLANGTGKIRIGIAVFTGTADATTGDPISSWGAEGTNPTLATDWAFANTPAAISVGTSWQDYLLENVSIASNANNIAILIWSDDKANTTTTDILRIGGYVTLTKGSVAAPAIVLPYAEEQARCFRRCFVVDAPTTFQYFGSGVFRSTTRATVYIPFPVKMARSPSTSVTAATDFGVWDGVTDFQASAIGTTGQSPVGVALDLTVTGATQYRPCMLTNWNWSTTGKIIFDADL